MQQRTDNMEISKNNISIAGEFAVLAQLALRGIDANLDAITNPLKRACPMS